MPDHNTESRGRSAAGVCVIAGLLLMLYPLSLGPAVWLTGHGWMGPDDGPVVRVLEVYYLPLAWCFQGDVPLLSPLLERYVEWCASL